MTMYQTIQNKANAKEISCSVCYSIHYGVNTQENSCYVLL